MLSLKRYEIRGTRYVLRISYLVLLQNVAKLINHYTISLHEVRKEPLKFFYPKSARKLLNELKNIPLRWLYEPQEKKI